MRILSICPAVPAVDAKGYQVQAYYRIRHLSKNHSVSVVCFGQGDSDERHRAELLDMGVNVRMLPWRLSVGLPAVFRAFFDSKIPLQCALFSSPEFSFAVNDVIRDTSPDVIHSTTIRVLPNLSSC